MNKQQAKKQAWSIAYSLLDVNWHSEEGDMHLWREDLAPGDARKIEAAMNEVLAEIRSRGVV